MRDKRFVDETVEILDETEVVTEYVNRLVIDVGVDEKDIAVISPYYAQVRVTDNER